MMLASLSPALADAPPASSPPAATPAQTPAQERKGETFIAAQQMSSDQNTGIVTATGHVEIARGGYILHADKVTYDTNTGVMHAEGHVAILNPTGEVEFADREEVTGDMNQAFAENIGILFPDNSRMAAKQAQRYGGRYTVMDNAIYTSCNVCKQDPNNPPLWQMRGETVVHDNTEHEVYYHDATIDFAGLPVLYTPYFSAPDPTVDRRQGFLTPTPGVLPQIGAFMHVPYYFDIAPDQDAIFAPTISQKDGLQLGGEYRRRFDDGSMQFDGSFTHADLISDTGTDEGYQWRGDLFGKTLFDLDNTWRAGTDIAFASDKSYLDRYKISSADQLTNRAYLEGFSGRDYAAVNSYYFEDLRPGAQVVQPLVLPEAEFSTFGEPGQTWGGRWSLGGSMLTTTRDNNEMSLAQQGPDTRRLSLNGGWQRQLISDTGLVTTVSGLLRGDTYWADNVINPDGSGNNFNNVFLARQFEQANVMSSYPMGRQGDGYQQMIEPIIAFTAAPDVKVNPMQPNEDSLDVEFDETNLFSPNRFDGTDLIEGGSRVTYGLRQTITTNSDAHLDMFGGQSYDFSRNTDFPDLSGLNTHSSDYVGRIDFVPAKWFSANYGFRLDHSDFTPRDEDAVISVGAPVFRPYVRYIKAEQVDAQDATDIEGLTDTTGTASATSTINQIEEGTVGFDSHFSKYWVLHGEHVQAFQPQPGPRSSSLSLNYIDECLVFGVTAENSYTNRVDLSSGTSVVFHLYLKNLGGVHTDSYTSPAFAPEFRQTQ